MANTARSDTLTAVFLLCLAIASAVPAWAHHAFAAEFDAKKPVHLVGVVTQMEMINPHSWIHLDVKNADGSTAAWMVEAGSPNVLLRRGFTKQSVLPGTAVVVDGYQAKDGTNRANARDITLPSGQKLFLGSSGTGAPGEEKDAK